MYCVTGRLERRLFSTLFPKIDTYQPTGLNFSNFHCEILQFGLILGRNGKRC